MRVPHLRRSAWPLALALTCLARIAGGGDGFSEEGAVACIDCHETPYVMGILQTKHADASDPHTPAARKQCQSCHGPSSVHMKFPMQVENVHFGKDSGARPEVQNRMCLDCHGDDPERKDWTASAHGFDHVVCSTCHSMHDPAAIVPIEAAVTSRCTESCHEDLMRGSAPTTFSHAVGRDLGGKGELTCAGCHNPHGPLGSGRCGDCHVRTPEEIAKESPKARRYHEVAEEKGTECMRCHKGIAHPIPPLVLQKSQRAMERLIAE